MLYITIQLFNDLISNFNFKFNSPLGIITFDLSKDADISKSFNNNQKISIFTDLNVNLKQILKIIKKIHDNQNTDIIDFYNSNNTIIDLHQKINNIPNYNNSINIYAKKKIYDNNIDNIGTIYLIRTRDNCDKNVYKIGKTRQTFMERFSNYPKGSEAILNIKCDSNILDNVETTLKHIFNDKFKRITEGPTGEYFEGNVNEMIFEIVDYIRKL